MRNTTKRVSRQSSTAPPRIVTGESKCRLDDLGVAVGLVSLPFRKEKDFYEQEIEEGIFSNYHNAVLEHRTGYPRPYDEQLKKLLYKPVPYFIFGAFDLAVVTLIDDFELMCRTFRPFDPMSLRDEKKEYPENFSYRVITGPSPKFSRNTSILRLARRAFLDGPRKPLFGMTQLKLNNSLLIGSGTDFLRAVITYIKDLREEGLKGTKTELVILESYSWHEVTLLFFSTAYAPIERFVLTLLNKTVSDLVDSSAGPARQLFEPDRSLLGTAAPNRVKSAHLFSHGESHLGFDFRLFCNPKSSRWSAIDRSDEMQLLTSWAVKPGHLHAALKALGREASEGVPITSGKADFIFPKLLPRNRPAGSPSRTVDVLRDYVTVGRTPSLSKHVVRRSSVTFTLSEKNRIPATSQPRHASFGAKRRPLSFSIREISSLKKSLGRLRTPKILSQQLLNMFANFNDGILDHHLYGYFLQLRPFMEDIQHLVSDWASHDSVQPYNYGGWCKLLERWVRNFERAHRNRFHNGSHLSDVTDFSLEFKGGIQQLVTAFDGAFKAIARVLGNESLFVHVAGDPGVFSTGFEVQLNYFHIFQPEMLVAVAAHEAGNGLWMRWPDLPIAQVVRRSDEGGRWVPDVTRWPDRRLRAAVAHAAIRRPDLAPAYQHLSNAEFFGYLVVDYLALNLTYNGDFDLFALWYFGYFHQFPQGYRSPGAVDIVELASFGLRMVSLGHIVGATDVEKKIGATMQRYWPEQRIDASALSEWFQEMSADPYVKEWLAELKRLADLVRRETFGARLADGNSSALQKALEKYGEMLASGEVPRFERIDNSSAPSHVVKLFHAYLRLIAAEFLGNGEGLERDAQGQPQVHKGAPPLLFDSTGGVFTHDARTRRRLFQLRSTLTMSLWDVAQKEMLPYAVRTLESARLRRH